MLKAQASLVVLALVAAGAVAQAQRGAPRPEVKPHTFDIESSYIRMPLPAGDERYGPIDGYRMKEHVRALTAIARTHHEAGERYWGRLLGSKADAEAEEYIAAKFREVRARRPYAAGQPGAAVAGHRLEPDRGRQRRHAHADLRIPRTRLREHAGRWPRPRGRLGRLRLGARLRWSGRHGQTGVPAQRPASQRLPGDGSFHRGRAARRGEGRRRGTRQRQHPRKRHELVRRGPEGAHLLVRVPPMRMR